MKFFHLDRAGIAPQDQATIFDKFTQADNSSTRVYGGTGSGLGLNISKRFVELLGGRISLRSQPGLGSTFEICLPARRDMPLPVPVTDFEAAHDALTDHRIQPSHRLLNVEDEPVTLALLQKMLRRSGCYLAAARLHGLATHPGDRADRQRTRCPRTATSARLPSPRHFPKKCL